MEQFATEEQQVEAIKRFWKDNGTAIILGAVLGLGGLWGWRYYSDSQLEAKAQASVEYQQAVETLQSDGGLSNVEQFISNHGDSGYASIARFMKVSKLVENNELEQAASTLQEVMSSTDDNNLKTLAGIQLARIQLEQSDNDKALATLEGLSNNAFGSLIAEVKGDVLAAQGKLDDARMAYTKALKDDASNQLVKMKLDNLAVATGS
ncbi:tetratricopeptide repeat protein [Salinimonas marina]|uniref:Ancillary SecYEG translocon subunit n=1 Tax=Salinimonas marina TaxID=2785918 RepID=A0A7S9HE03_9ALTE|nr:tetratricopeptide repeat protein [Salinimonas marina]QPG06472.1 tetratricopeptide repeat protein [Salinimonas marina]